MEQEISGDGVSEAHADNGLAAVALTGFGASDIPPGKNSAASANKRKDHLLELTKDFVIIDRWEENLPIIDDLSSLTEDTTVKDQNSIGERFAKFLDGKGKAKPGVAALLDEFISSEMPELAVLPAVQELRSLYAGADETPKVKTPYPGKRAAPDSIGFLLENYGEEIRSGTLDPGQLQRMDKRLYHVVYLDLAAGDPSMSVRQFFDQVRGDRRATKPDRQAMACAVILGTTPNDAARFLNNLRPDRLKKWGDRTP